MILRKKTKLQIVNLLFKLFVLLLLVVVVVEEEEEKKKRKKKKNYYYIFLLVLFLNHWYSFLEFEILSVIIFHIS